MHPGESTFVLVVCLGECILGDCALCLSFLDVHIRSSSQIRGRMGTPFCGVFQKLRRGVCHAMRFLEYSPEMEETHFAELNALDDGQSQPGIPFAVSHDVEHCM